MAKKVEASNRVKSSQLENKKEKKKKTNKHNQVEVARSGSALEITKGSEKMKKTKDKVRKNRNQTEEKVGKTEIGALRNDEVAVEQSEAVVGNLLRTCESKKSKKKERIDNGMANEGKNIEEEKSKKKRMKEHEVLTEGGVTEGKRAKKKRRKELMKMKEGMVEKTTEEADLGDVNTKSLGDEDPSKGMKREPKKSKKKKRKVNDLVNESENIEEKKSEKRRKEDEGLKEGGFAEEKKGKKNGVQDLMMLKNGMVEKKREEVNAGDVYIISSGDEDSSKGMKKWITEYHQKRPGLEVLQERIDEFIIVHEERVEQEKREREALAAEGGWTVVTHHKGRKKTTDSETGTTVGSVSQAAVEDQMTKKPPKELGDFYRFQKREAQRNELMALRNKYEQDKKRIQHLRAARKFRPY